MQDVFRKIAHGASSAVGSPWAFMLAIFVVVAWAASGPLFGFSDTWQLVINTGTTIVTFLMVFLIQNAQNRDARAMHLKVDELLRATKGARTGLVNLESLSDAKLREFQTEFERLQSEFGVVPFTAEHIDRELEERRASDTDLEAVGDKRSTPETPT